MYNSTQMLRNTVLLVLVVAVCLMTAAPKAYAYEVKGRGTWGKPPKLKVDRAAGHIPIMFELAQATKVSLAVYDKEGHIIRTCLGAEPMAAGKQTCLWDGLDDYDRPAPAGVKEKLPLEGSGSGATTGPQGELYVGVNNPTTQSRQILQWVSAYNTQLMLYRNIASRSPSPPPSGLMAEGGTVISHPQP
jgi:hypothetical protein